MRASASRVTATAGEDSYASRERVRDIRNTRQMFRKENTFTATRASEVYEARRERKMSRYVRSAHEHTVIDIRELRAVQAFYWLMPSDGYAAQLLLYQRYGRSYARTAPPIATTDNIRCLRRRRRITALSVVDYTAIVVGDVLRREWLAYRVGVVNGAFTMRRASRDHAR